MDKRWPRSASFSDLDPVRNARTAESSLAPHHPPEADVVLKSLQRSGAKPSMRGKLDIALGDARLSHDGAGSKKRRRETLADTIRMSIETNLDRLLEHDHRLRRDAASPMPATFIRLVLLLAAFVPI
jgi:hypothetical protein